MMLDHKDLHNEAIKKLNKEIAGYQQRLEKQDVIIKQLREELHDKENQFPNLLLAQQTMQQGGTVMDSLLFGYNEQDHKNRLKMIHNELEENRLKRQEEIRKLREDPTTEAPKHQIKFDKVWDIHNSAVDIQKSDPMNIFKFGEETQSQMLQSGLQRNAPGGNIIEETYEDLT